MVTGTWEECKGGHLERGSDLSGGYSDSIGKELRRNVPNFSLPLVLEALTGVHTGGLRD